MYSRSLPRQLKLVACNVSLDQGSLKVKGKGIPILESVSSDIVTAESVRDSVSTSVAKPLVK